MGGILGKSGNRGIASIVFDVSFIMALCFAVLLVTMLIQSDMAGYQSAGYVITVRSIAAVVVYLVVYLIITVKKSRKELAEIEEIAYADEQKEKF
ncbi:MAG: hypothetical protein LKJ83_06535 [Eubacteriaceae bacterium]|nr:hypothetical protein [Eubacteriaceae bacterium]